MKDNEGWEEGREGQQHHKKQSSGKPICVPLMHVFPNKSKQRRKEQGGVNTGWVSTEGGVPCMHGDSNFRGLALIVILRLHTCVYDSLKIQDFL